jgi:chromosome segregation ATPase
MKTKLVLWGKTEPEEKVLITLQLRPEENMVDVWTFPEAVATDEFVAKMMNSWRDGGEVEFPDPHTHTERELSVTDSLLPEGLTADRQDLVQRAQTEWHFIVLSSKLHTTYETELGELKERVSKLEQYDKQIWENLKEFWGKVQHQVQDQNLFRDHANSLRDKTNQLFGQMKELRSKMDEEFTERSKKVMDTFHAALEEIEGRISEGSRLQNIFDELKKFQRQFRDAKMTRSHRSKVWERMDAAFKAVKEKRFGPDANTDNSPLQRINRRYKGLLSAIEKMERSIQRDRDDLSFQERKIERSDGQLEAQIRQAKIKMIEERIRSKEDKLSEMMNTKIDLEKRIEKLTEKEAQRQKQEEVEAAKKLAKEKIAKEIEENQARLQDQEEDLEKAAEEISSAKKSKESASASIEDQAEEVKEAIEQAAEEVKAVVAPAPEADVKKEEEE